MVGEQFQEQKWMYGCITGHTYASRIIIILIQKLYLPFSTCNVHFMSNWNVSWCLSHAVLIYNKMRYNK